MKLFAIIVATLLRQKSPALTFEKFLTTYFLDFQFLAKFDF